MNENWYPKLATDWELAHNITRLESDEMLYIGTPASEWSKACELMDADKKKTRAKIAADRLADMYAKVESQFHGGK